jgi:hypothetical protein
MKKLLLSISALAALGGCATVPDDATVVAVNDTEYPTGSNIPRKKSSANTTTMTADQAEDMRRSIEAQRTLKK